MTRPPRGDDTTPAPHTPLRVEVELDGRLCLEPDQAVRLVLALKHQALGDAALNGGAAGSG